MWGRGLPVDGRILITGSAVVAGGSAVAATWWFTGPWSALVGAVGATIAGVWSARGLARRDSSAAAQLQLSRHIQIDVRGRLPLVRACLDPIALGVHPAASGSSVADRVPPFVARDFSERLQDALQAEDFVLLIGESTAGKTRAAYQAMMAALGDHMLLELRDRAGIAAAVEAARGATRPCVVWLDDLERFLGTGGLTRGDIRALVSGGQHRHTIVATMRAEEHARFLHGGRQGVDQLHADAQRQGEEVIRLAHRIHAPRRWSIAELARLHEHRDDPRICEALAHADTFGVSEYLAAGPQLVGAWQDAWAPATHPRGAALVSAGVLARRSGMHRPLAAQELEQVAAGFLEQRGGVLLRPEPHSEAVAWATTPLFATSSLLLPDEHGSLRAFDYLIDALPKEQPPAAALTALVAVATLDEVLDLAELAYGWEHLDIAEAAYRRALAHPDPRRRAEAVSGLSYVIDTRDGSEQALRFASDIAREREARLGPTHPETLDARSVEAWHIHHSGDSARALAVAEPLVSAARGTPGITPEFSLALRRGVAQFHSTLGHHAEAAQVCWNLAQDWEAYAGADSHSAVESLVFHARHSGRAQGPDAAYANVQAVFRDARLAPGTDAYRDLGHLLAYQALEAHDYATAARLFAERADAVRQEVGTGHSNTLHLQYELAGCLWHLAETAEAIRLLHQIVADHEALSHRDQRLGLRYRLRLAIWIGAAGDPGEAAQQLRHLVAVSRDTRGADDPLTLRIRSHAAHWTAETGDVVQALGQSRDLLADCDRILGPTASLTTTVRERNSRWERALPPVT